MIAVIMKWKRGEYTTYNIILCIVYTFCFVRFEWHNTIILMNKAIQKIHLQVIFFAQSRGVKQFHITLNSNLYYKD